MQCFVHVGIERTAVTQLQSFLALNTHILRNKKVVYLNNYFSAKDFLLLADGLSSGELINKVKPLVNQSKDHLFLISSSDLHSEFSGASELLVLRENLKQIGFTEIKIIIYLRDQVGLAPALFSYLARKGESIECIPFPSDNTGYATYFKNICDHRKAIERFASVFHAENLIVRLFHKDALKNKSTLEDFLDIFSIAWCDEFLTPASEPKALANPGPEILGRVNKKIPPSDDPARVSLRKLLIASFDELFTDQAYILSPELYQAYVEAYAESNEWVRQQFFPERSNLFPSRRLPEKIEHGLSGKQLDNIANMLADIWLENEKDLY